MSTLYHQNRQAFVGGLRCIALGTIILQAGSLIRRAILRTLLYMQQVCDGLTHAQRPLCNACLANPQFAAGVLTARESRMERQSIHLVRTCLHCGGGGGRDVGQGGIACDSLDCGVYFERRKVAAELAVTRGLRDVGLNLWK